MLGEDGLDFGNEITFSKSYDSLYKTLFEQVNAAVFFLDFDGEILEANWRSCDLYGYSWKELSRMSFTQVFKKDYDWESFQEELSSMGGLNFESENIRKDGSKFPVEISTSLFSIDSKPVILALVRDITERKKAEEELKTSEQRYRTIFDNSAVSIMLTDENENIVSWNKYTEKMLGLKEEDLLNKHVKSIYPEEEWLKIRAKNVRKKGVQHHLETRMIKKDGSLIDVDISVTVLKDAEGKPKGSIGVIRDISDRKKAELKLKENEEKYRSLFESTVDGTFVLDSRGEIIDVNNRALEMFGIERNQIIGNNFLSMDLLTAKSLPVVVKQFGDLLSGKNAKSEETEIKTERGEVLNVEVSSFFLVKSRLQEVDNFVVNIRDISDRKQTEIKLAKEHSLLQTLMDNIPDSIYFKDEQSRYVLVNKAKAHKYGLEPEEMIGKTDFDFMSDEQAKKAFEDDLSVMNTGKFIIDKCFSYKDKDGSERWMSVTKVPRFDEEGNIVGTAGISKDITKWVNKEQKTDVESC